MCCYHFLWAQSFTPPCDVVHLDEDYNSTAGWTFNVTDPGTLQINGGVMQYNNPPGAVYNIAYTPLVSALPDEYWTAECKFTPSGGNAPGHYLMAFTAGTLDPISYGAPGYSTTNQDGIFVFYAYNTTPLFNDCCTNPANGPWQITPRMKKGNVLSPVFPGIPATQMNIPYYIRLERLTPSFCRLSVFSDHTYTTHITGSPIGFCIDSTITGLNTFQQGVVTWGSWYRRLAGNVDSVKVCSYSAPVEIDTIFLNCSDPHITLQPPLTGSSYHWSSSASMSCTDCASPNIEIPDSGQAQAYQVTIETVCGQIARTLVVKNNGCAKSCFDVQIPNVFTPNNDNQNDLFKIATCGLKKFHCEIYNRWGVEIFESNDTTDAWNGQTPSGASCTEGVYFYRVDAAGAYGQQLSRAGCLHLFR